MKQIIMQCDVCGKVYDGLTDVHFMDIEDEAAIYWGGDVCDECAKRIRNAGARAMLAELERIRERSANGVVNDSKGV